jgi:uncharacterized membrane protein YcaP (DUF421 family)
MATILRAIAGYFILLLVVRVLGRRAGSKMTMFDFVLIFLLGASLSSPRSTTIARSRIVPAR